MTRPGFEPGPPGAFDKKSPEKEGRAYRHQLHVEEMCKCVLLFEFQTVHIVIR
jgi:hypothetical protein